MVQIALVLLFWTKLDTFADRVDRLTGAVGQVPGHHLEAGPFIQNPPLADPISLTGQDVRQIVREELRTVVSTLSPTQNPDPVAVSPPVDEIEMQYQRDLVALELDYLKEQDEVTPMELDKLMGDIAELDPESRTELLKMLNRAMNRGEIKGNF